ncbi:MAG: DUF3883 domain-containing protein [Rhodobacteraceae bacterium]|nr:DUF3883 domain-containing protein [Paracoccaceae bacterium]
MSLEGVRRTLVDRLDEGDRGDRGWFVITRVHVAVSWLKAIAEYLENRGGGGSIQLTDHDYQRLARIIGTEVDDPGVQLRRHHLLVMDKPLQLLQRVNGTRWHQTVLTDRGRDLAYTDDPAAVLEQSLSAIRFAVEPWTPRNRVGQYGDFDLRAYKVTKQVLKRCEGYIDRNEFDFFVSRIRRRGEASKAAAAITAYRALTPEEQDTLHSEVRDRIPGDKAYSNWRDVGLHTFSLFSLGTSMVREGTRLLLTADWVGAQAVPAAAPVAPAPPPQLRIPEPPEVEELLSPPATRVSNDGADAESFVAKVLRSQGWEVAFYTNRRGYGFDLWARRQDRAMVVEVKSSVAALGAVSLTPTEYRAAQEHGDSYVLALVEHMDSVSPRLRMIQNPVAALQVEERRSASYVIARAEWLRVADRVA